jgi:hypothetical protein
MTGPSALWVEAMTWAGANGAHHEIPGLWSKNAGALDGVSLDVTANTHPDEIDGVPAFGVRLTSPTHMMAGVLTPSGGAIIGGAPGDEDRLIAFFADLNAKATGAQS